MTFENLLQHVNRLSGDIISFSLYGNDEIYTSGILANAKEVDKFYPGWQLVVFYSDCVSLEIIDKLNQLNAKTIFAGQAKGHLASLWRFLPIEAPNVQRVLVRDADSRLNDREVAAVNDWISSKLDVHLMRDHPFHNAKIMAGMFGAKGGQNFGLTAKITSNMFAFGTQNKGIDQKILGEFLYPKIVNRSMVHDAFYNIEKNAYPFPTKRKNNEYVGEIVQANGAINQEHRVLVSAHQKNIFKIFQNFLKSLIWKYNWIIK